MTAQPCTVQLVITNRAGFIESLGSVERGLAELTAPERILERFPQLFDPCLDGAGYTILEAGKFFQIRGHFGAASGAGKLALSAEPSECFREFVAAIARDGEWQVFEVHGWPVLSLVGRNASVAEAGGPSTLPGGSGAAAE